MVMVTAHFEHVAEEVTERTAELLGALVTVTDERGVVIASSERGSTTGRTRPRQFTTPDSQRGQPGTRLTWGTGTTSA